MTRRYQKISILLSILMFMQYVIFPFLTPVSDNQPVYAQSNDIKINFQPESVNTPAGYIPDYGEIFGSRNGFTYGWNIDHTDMTVTRETYEAPERNSFARFHREGVWEIALPDGFYDVTVSVGDAVYKSTNTINVEGVNYFDQLELNGGDFSQKTDSIHVNDGKLTIDQGNTGEGKTKINFVEIIRNSDTTPPSIPQNLRLQDVTENEISFLWDASTDKIGVEGYYVYRNDQRIATVTGSVYYSDSGLMPDTEYRYEVAAFDHDGNVSEKSTSLTVTTLASTGNGVGIKAEYFDGADFADLKLTQLDPQIDFNWGAGAPDPDMNPDSFSIRWTGKIEPQHSEIYTFYTETHGGVRLWIDNQLLIDKWNASGMSSFSGTIQLVAGQKYDIKMEYREDNGVAKARLLWSSNSQIKEVVPRAQLYPPFIPEPPANINASSTSTTLTLTWDEVEGATGYEVELNGSIIDNGGSNQFVQENLNPDTEYQYRVRSKVPEVNSGWSPSGLIYTKIAPPQNVAATESEGSITVSWDTVSGADGYEIEVDRTIIDNGQDTVFVHSNLMPETEHTYRVRAINEHGKGDWSPLVVKKVQSDIPANIKAEATSNTITLTWDPVPDAVGYDVEVDGVVIDNGTNTSYVHSSLEPNTQHTYRVRARKADGVGNWSPVIVQSTLPASGTGTGLLGEYFDGDQLTDLITSRVDGQIDFDWKNNDPAPGVGESDFSVRWTGQIEPLFSETYTFSTEAHGGMRLWINNQLIIDEWTDHHMSRRSGEIYLEAGQRYDIKLEYREYNGVAMARLFWESESQPKAIVPQSQLYPVGIPKNNETDSTQTTITLTWDPVTFADRYEVAADGNVVDVGSSTSFTHKDLTPGTQHIYRIRAINGVAKGEWSPTITAYTELGVPVIQSIQATETTITVRWEPVLGASKYEIEVDGQTIDVGSQTVFEHTGLLSGTRHTYRVRAKSSVVTGDWTTLEEKWTLPGIPQNIQTSSTSHTITLKWDDVRGATGYEVEVYNTIVDNKDLSSYTEDGLNPNTQRTYRVRAKNSSGPGKWSAVIAETTLPGVPEGLRASATDTQIEIQWDPSAGATAYDLEVDGVVVPDIANTTYVHSGLEPNTTHTYRVRAKNEKGMSNWSDPIHPTTRPPVPEITEVNATSTTIIVNWNQVMGATGYEIEVDGVVINIGDNTSFTHDGLEPNTEHTYRVRAVNRDITSFWSELVSSTTHPGIPTNIHTTVESTKITVTWDPVPGATGYEVEADGVVISNGLNTTFVHEGLQPNSTHTYRVRALNSGGPGNWSELITATTVFGKPTNLNITSTSDTITLTWDPVPGATGYDVMVDGEVMDTGNSTTFVHKGLEPNSWHVYRVRAKSGDVVGEWSDAVTGRTILATPANIRTEVANNEIIVMWDAVSGADGYEIEVDGSVIDNGSDTSFTHTDLEPNTEHTYRVRAYSGDVYSEWSELVTVMTAPGVPEILSAEATPYSITIHWTEIEGATSYDLEIDGEMVEGITGTSYTHEGLEPNTMHLYRVRAVHDNVVSEWSPVFEQITDRELTVQVEKDNEFNFVFVAPIRREGMRPKNVVVHYDPEQVEVLDLSAITPETELSEGEIEGTGITVVSFKPGEIVYQINSLNTAFNSIKFMSKTNDYIKITYTFE
ncbi:MAG: hypothetical protein H0Z33_17195 [Bacillaceae bacterium]|nr:hypothetical protein [Bacillaceae bacterium]